jgi:CRISPR system Cascade subunit CasA
MSYDLRREPWIPWRRRSGVVEWAPPAVLVSRMTGENADPVVAIAAPRPDFDGALQEFLIGLLSAALQPADERAWKAGWESPPTVDEMQTAIDALPDAFDLDGDGPRFFQDLSESDVRKGERWTIETFLIGTPGSTTNEAERRQFTTELFVKPGRVLCLCRPAAAMTLLTMQTYAPEGGRGHLTSMRGGGPLTTLVDPRPTGRGELQPELGALWYKLWANVETMEQAGLRSTAASPQRIESAFPWLNATRASDPPKRVTTTPADVHALQAYFGLPRRVRLEFDGPGRCDLTGNDDSRTVTSFWMRGSGTRYEQWVHPLSPYSFAKSAGGWGPMHGQPGGFTWRDWAGLTLSEPNAEKRPAQAVSAFARRARGVKATEFAVDVFGYDTKQNKARAWISATLPAFAADDTRRKELYSTARAMIEAASMAGSALFMAVKTALFQSPDDATGDLGQVKLELWSATECDFYAAMRSVADESLDADGAMTRVDDVRRGFAPVLERAATSVFDRRCPAGGLDVDALRRRVAARYQLTSALRGYSKLGESMFAALGIALPGGGRVVRAARKSKTAKEKTA